MKTKLFLLALTIASFMACKNDASKAAATATTPTQAQAPDANAAPKGPTTKIEFTETEYDFGTIKQGDKANHVFKFKNTGTEPLVIENAVGSCGCTVPTWPKEPVAPGAVGDVAVEFNSAGKSGDQSKRVTITANTDPVQSFLTIKGKVDAPTEPAQDGTAKKQPTASH